MTKTREFLARRARLRRQIARKLSQQQAAVRRSHISEVLIQVRTIISDQNFVALLANQKVDSVPECLSLGEFVTSNGMTDSQIANSILNFVVAWKFLFPILGSPKIAAYLEQTWPGFIMDFKDTFITLVMDGPFPGERRTPVRPTYFS